MCDPIPVVDGQLMNFFDDPWIPFTGYCDGSAYDCNRTGTFYHYNLYNGPKEDGIRNNPYLSHSGGDRELGRPEVIRLLDIFFETFPVSFVSENPFFSLVETQSTPSFDPPLFFKFLWLIKTTLGCIQCFQKCLLQLDFYENGDSFTIKY